MSALDMLARNASQQKGVWHINAIRSLRDYIRQCSDKELLEAISHINNVDWLRTLIEAGLHEPLLTAVTKRAEEIPKRMRGEVT
jgi:phosphatidylinositol kinase/protein kinase (PI-3  family)